MRVLAIFVAVLVPLSAVAEPPPPGPQIGKPAPLFSLRDREGALVSLGDLAYAGPDRPTRPRHVVVLDFFRTDCKPCRAALPRLAALHKRYAARGLQVVLVALLEDEEGREKLDTFLEATPLPFTVLVDAYGVAGGKYVRNGARYTIPATFIVDRTGVLRERAGALDDKQIKRIAQIVEGLVAGR